MGFSKRYIFGAPIKSTGMFLICQKPRLHAGFINGQKIMRSKHRSVYVSRNNWHLRFCLLHIPKSSQQSTYFIWNIYQVAITCWSYFGVFRIWLGTIMKNPKQIKIATGIYYFLLVWNTNVNHWIFKCIFQKYPSFSSTEWSGPLLVSSSFEEHLLQQKLNYLTRSIFLILQKHLS